MSQQAARAIPDGSLVLITGATGYIGSRVAEAFVKFGYRIRVTYRTEDKAKMVKDKLESTFGPDKVELYHVPNMGAADAYDEAIKGVSAVVHVAGDLTMGTDAKAIIDNVVAGNTNLLRLAAAEPTVKRFVLTSSSTAMANAHQDDFTYSDKVWNDAAVEKAYAGPVDAGPGLETPMAVYSASKTLGERSMWEFMEREKPAFVANSVLPDFTMGPALDDSIVSSTLAMVKALWTGDEQVTYVYKNMLPQQWWVSVSDIALLHLGAGILDDVRGERLLGFAEPYSINDVLKVMRQLDPERKLTDDIEVKEDKSKVENAKSVEVLKRLGQDGWSDFAATVKSVLV